MERSAEDLINDFKSKVEEAINLLPQIPETQREDLWTYWQVISVAVKAAVGGRGPILVKPTKTGGTSRGRPRGRGRPRVFGSQSLSQREQHVWRIESSAAIKIKHDSRNGTVVAKTAQSNAGKQNDFAEANIKVSLPNQDLSVSPVEKSTPVAVDGTVCSTGSSDPKEKSNMWDDNTSNKEQQHAVSAQWPAGFQSASSIDHGCEENSHTTENTSLVKQEVVMKTSRGEDNVPHVDFVSVPKELVATQSSETATQATGTNSTTDDNETDDVKVVTLNLQIPAHSTDAASLHQGHPTKTRKRGRPPKSTTTLSHPGQLTSSSTTAEVEDTTVDQKIPAQNFSGNGALNHEDIMTKEEDRTQNGLQSIITALELEEKKNKDAKETAPSAAKVRRSERRSAPNRDKLFCYFDKTKQEDEEKEEEEEAMKEEGEEEEGDAESGTEPVVQDTQDLYVKMQTEEEKAQQRTCTVCGVELMSASSMAVHMRVHTGDRPFSCPVCNKTFTTKGNRERHKATHVGLKAFTCTECNKKFTEKKSLKIHTRSHTGERPYGCDICQMRFFQTGTLKTHMDRHTGRKSHLCELCGKAFRQGCQLRVHMRRHAKNMAFPCKHCTKRFYTKSDMERHELKHTGERPFACDKCPETFTRQHYLREHQNTHLGRRPYKCVICGLSFHDFASCHRHVNKHKITEVEQPPQQIHVEVGHDVSTQQVIEQVQVILDQQNLPGFHGAQIQTLLIPDTVTTSGQTVSTDIATTAATADSSAQTILRKLMLGVDDSSSAEVYHVTLVDNAQDVTVTTETGQVQTVTEADFSAINLLASATTQLSLPH
ncbi:uncharacterized protein [Littorina saxatilis]|uniref:C2H2-type domain-containing protein n=1 Tax=Littorina saxatilis TaxID=31220 RepID=A0AAN9BBQ4_9CAEN